MEVKEIRSKDRDTNVSITRKVSMIKNQIHF